MNTKNTAIVCAAIFATVSSIVWAITVCSLYAPPMSAREMEANALQQCGRTAEARSSQFCMKLAEKTAAN